MVVTKADGTKKTVTVASVSRSFDVDGVSCVYGAIAEAANKWATHGAGGRCAECGRPGATTMCSDSSGIQGMCCPRCARMSRYERSFA
mgnify:CR=1 FL=1